MTRRIVSEYAAPLALAAVMISTVLGWIIGTSQATRDISLTENSFTVQQEGWFFSETVGSVSADPLERARIAVGGPLALSSSEAVYFLAKVDSEGKELLSNCDYRVSGGQVEARWWSLTLYKASDGSYIENDQNRSSWTSASLPIDGSGRWSMMISQQRLSDRTLPAPQEDGIELELLLRLYHPSDSLRSALPAIALPRIETIQC